MLDRGCQIGRCWTGGARLGGVGHWTGGSRQGGVGQGVTIQGGVGQGVPDRKVLDRGVPDREVLDRERGMEDLFVGRFYIALLLRQLIVLLLHVI